MDIDDLRKVGTCVFLAAEKDVAEDIAKHIMDAADEIERLRATLRRIRDHDYTPEDEALTSEQPTMIWQLVAGAALADQ